MIRSALRGRTAASVLAGLAPGLLPGLLPPLLAQDVPQAQEATAKKAPEPPAAPFLWHVEGATDDGAPIEAYLFGTVHLPDERVVQLHPEVERAFEASGSFYSEIRPTDAAKVRIQQAAQLPEDLSLSQLTGEPLWSRIQARLKGKGVPEEVARVVYDRFEPWAVSALLPQLDYLKAQMKGVASLDESLFLRARAAKMPTRGLETVDEQISVFTAFKRSEQVELLREGLDQLERDERAGKNPIEETVLAWLSGEEGRLLDILEASFQIDAALRRRAEDGLLWERNLRFADRIDGALKADTDNVAFIAIGALHMPDPRSGKNGRDEARDAAEPRRAGLVTLLRERGYRLTRVAVPEPVGAPR